MASAVARDVATRCAASGPNFVDETTRSGIAKLGWGVDRPPRRKRTEGQRHPSSTMERGEDFLFMHRWMIKMVRNDYAMQGPGSARRRGNRCPPPTVAPGRPTRR